LTVPGTRAGTGIYSAADADEEDKKRDSDSIVDGEFDVGIGQTNGISFLNFAQVFVVHCLKIVKSLNMLIVPVGVSVPGSSFCVKINHGLNPAAYGFAAY
jgi:hypothetical protein